MRRPWIDRRSALPLLLALALPLAGCGASMGAYTPIAQLPPPPATSQTIEPGDLLSVQVWNAEHMSSKQRVLDDGTISLFFLAGLHVAGLTPGAVADSIAGRIGDIVQSPRVNVVIEEVASHQVSVIGEVQRPGSNPVLRAPTLLDALAAAGGLTPFAHHDRIFVIRSRPTPLRLRVDYDALVRGETHALAFRLQAGDVIEVE